VEQEKKKLQEQKIQPQVTTDKPLGHGFMERSVRLGEELEDVIKKSKSRT